MQLSPTPSLLLIYLIEDNPIDIFIVQQMLELTLPQALLISFSSASQALVELNGKKGSELTPAPILLLDLDMPLSDGWEFLENYQNSPFYRQKPAPVYILTASINPNDVLRSKAYPCVAGFLSKPLNEEHLSLFNSKLADKPLTNNPPVR